MGWGAGYKSGMYQKNLMHASVKVVKLKFSKSFRKSPQTLIALISKYKFYVWNAHCTSLKSSMFKILSMISISSYIENVPDNFTE